MSLDAFLTRLDSLSSLTEADRAAVAALDVRRRSITRRKVILSQNDRPDYVYTILSGWAARYEVRRDGMRRITGFLLPGDFCGIHAVCHASMDHSIVALTDCELGMVDREAMGSVARSSPAIFDAIWRAKLVEEAILRKWLVYHADATKAVGHLLCELFARAEVARLVTDGKCHVPLTQEEIGDAMGITAVHVNRVMQRLRASGMLDLYHQELTIKDSHRLRQEAEFNPSYLQPWLTDAAQ